MRFVITPATILLIWACSVAQAQNAPKTCDAECVQRLQQSLSDLQQRVSALEQQMETTGTIGQPGPDVYTETFIANPATLTPYISELSCRRHEQTVIVPSEDGGIRQINVRRC
jgi:hypothetical protein